MVVMGRVIAPLGVRGWIKVKTFTQAADGLLDYRSWWLATATGWEAHAVAEAELRPAGLVARLAGCTDRGAAEALHGAEVGIPRGELPEPKRGEYYWADLVGCEVRNLEGELLGRVKGFIETGANDVVVLQAERERLLPWVESVVVRVELEKRRVTVDWGLDY